MPHGVSSQSFFLRLVSLSQCSNGKIRHYAFFHFAKMPPLAESKWDLKIHLATSSYHIRSRGIVDKK